MFSTYKYYCPKCDVKLNYKQRVNFKIMKEGKFVTILQLNPRPGDYEYECDPKMTFKKGEVLDFYCPSCNENLCSDRFKDFVSVLLRPADKIEFEVLFARAAGQHTTYVMTEDMVEKHGDHPKDLM